ncbi:hypothetical protein [Oricola cellulosilytica]|uniref:Uncharacterized protein n=1 Tax=Oricola cellulosilytica TaxID=1429082 RepID=A0A4R0PE66_9HYPH|nr:hypothetical protein [Oricola cellulosilytica]TCD14485.1 hypothetical protein E0D97_10530 [Oricola cellulosilytica]
MRQLLSGSIFFSWMAFALAVTVGGLPQTGASAGLLREMQRLLTEPAFLGLSSGMAQGVITVMVAVTLALMLWALMFSLTGGDDDYPERMTAEAAAFSWTLGVTGLWMLIAMAIGGTSALPALFVIYMVTLVSMLAAGGVEFAWEGRPVARNAKHAEERMARRLAAHMALSSARLAERTHKGSAPRKFALAESKPGNA